MARILCAWELGAHLGHLGQLKPVARALEHAHGHEILGARPPRLRLRRLPAGGQVPLDQALDSIDFGAVAGWHRIFDAARPDAVLLNAAPRASAAAKARGIPRFVVSDGYWLPERTRHRDLLWGDTSFLATFAELDHHAPRPGAQYCGALYLDEGEPPAWTGNGRPRVAAYLRAAWPPLRALAQALRDKDCDSVFFVPDADDTLLDTLRAAGARAQRTPLRLFDSRDLPGLTICHAGHGTVAAGLLNGVPLLLAPRYVEQDITARNVVRLGAGRRVAPDATAAVLRQALDELLDTPDCREAASAFRAAHPGYSPAGAAARIAASIDTAFPSRRLAGGSDR